MVYVSKSAKKALKGTMRSFAKNVGKASKTKPARLRGSTMNYRINKAVARAVNGVSENKIRALASYNEDAPSAIQLGANAYVKAFTVGSIPSVWSGISGLSPLGGMTFTQGTDANQRVGKFIYLQKTHFSMEDRRSVV